MKAPRRCCLRLLGVCPLLVCGVGFDAYAFVVKYLFVLSTIMGKRSCTDVTLQCPYILNVD